MPSAGEANTIVIVLSGPIGLDTVDLLARLQLAVRRLGGSVMLRAVPNELIELLALVGLGDAFGPTRELPDRGGQAEEREQPVGVEEERDP